MNSPKPIAQVVGDNARRLRGDNRIDDVAKRATALGLKWNSGRISDLERGRISPTLPTLFVLAIVLSDVAQQPVSLADLVEYDGDLILTEKLHLPSEVVAQALRGVPADQRPPDDEGFFGADIIRIAIGQAGGEAEMRAAQALGISGGRFKALSKTLWGHTYAEERDRRAGAGANTQKRGQVSRELRAEMAAALEADPSVQRWRSTKAQDDGDD